MQAAKGSEVYCCPSVTVSDIRLLNGIQVKCLQTWIKKGIRALIENFKSTTRISACNYRPQYHAHQLENILCRSVSIFQQLSLKRIFNKIIINPIKKKSILRFHTKLVTLIPKVFNNDKCEGYRFLSTCFVKHSRTFQYFVHNTTGWNDSYNLDMTIALIIITVNLCTLKHFFCMP